MNAPLVTALSFRERASEFLDAAATGFTPPLNCPACAESLAGRCEDCSRRETLAKGSSDGAWQVDAAESDVEALAVLSACILRLIGAEGSGR